MDPSKSLSNSVDTVQQQTEENNSKYKHSGQILFRKTNFKAFAEGPTIYAYSDPAEYINGMPWRIQLKKCGEHFRVYLQCDADPNDMAWSCQASCQFSIVSCTNDNKCFMQKGEFDHFAVHSAIKYPCWGYANFATFEEVMDPQNGLYDQKEDAVTFKAEIVTQRPKGMSGLRTDDILLVNGKMVNVNKYHLAGQSEFFQRLFFGKDAEPMPKIVIDDDENAVANFEQLISLVNCPNDKVDDECVENILLLASRFLLDSVENHCVKFLMSESKKSAICKFRLAHQCGIIGMKDKILQKMTKEDFGVAPHDHYDILSEHDKLNEEAAEEMMKRHTELLGNK